MALHVLESGDAAVRWLAGQGARRLVGDSRRLKAGDAFIAWPGQVHDGRRFVASALAAGAAACLVEPEGAASVLGGEADDARVAGLHGLKAGAGALASRFLGEPSAALDVIAVTGTNGKTSSTWWIAQALSQLGRRCGVIGTLGVGEPEAVVPTGLTTPDPVTLQSALRGFVDAGFAACAVEASSIGIVEHRLDGTRVAVAVFTNFTQDHLEYHGDMAAYWQAKAQLFAWPGLRAAVVNVDDAQGEQLAASLAASKLDVWTISARGPARLMAQAITTGIDGLAFEVVEGDARVPLRTSMLGDYNVANLLGVLGALRALGVALAPAVQACAGLTPVPGRMQRVGLSTDGDAQAATRALPTVVVDYAHTPDALEKALTALAPLTTASGGRVWCVFGCGGDRDASKRPLMGAIACRLAGHVVVTSDNPRHEPPGFIIAQILVGALGHDEVDVFEDRAEAIRHAVLAAAPHDVVLIAGKGHEDYQDVAGTRLHFSDAEQVGLALEARARAAERTDATAGTSTMMSLGDAARLLPVARLVGDAAIPILRIHSDSRSARPGDLFVALRGEHFDAHDFLAQVKAAGVAAVLAERGIAAAGLPGLEVPDSRLALGELAAAWRRRYSMPLVAVTGSNGKTTVTQMIAAIFQAWQGEHAFATVGNFNNDIGVPLTLLRLGGESAREPRVAVVELGMNHPGEIARLAAIAAPTIVLVNNAQREHLEFMQSVEAVARENGAAIEALSEDGIAVFPADDAHTTTWRELAGGRRVVSFALDGAGDAPIAADAGVTGSALWQAGAWQLSLRTPLGNTTCTLQVAGLHNVRNALAATACAIAAGCPLQAIADGLAGFRAVKGRSQGRRFVRAGVAATLIDDTYNANPDSVRAAIDVLAALPGPRWLLLGDMGEVGDQGPAFHHEVGSYAAERGIEALWCCGPLSEHTAAAFAGARWVAEATELAAAVGDVAAQPAFASAVVKGSRFMRMERVVAALLATGDKGGEADAA